MITEILELKNEHSDTWRDRSNFYWLWKLFGEFVELGLSLCRLHRHFPEWELMQIAAIAMNWVEKIDIKERGGKNGMVGDAGSTPPLAVGSDPP